MPGKLKYHQKYVNHNNKKSHPVEVAFMDFKVFFIPLSGL